MTCGSSEIAASYRSAVRRAKQSVPVSTRMTGTRKPRSGLVLVPVPAAPATTPPAAAMPIASSPMASSPVAAGAIAAMPVVAAMPVAARTQIRRLDRVQFGGLRFLNPDLLRLLVALALLAGGLGVLRFVRFVERFRLGNARSDQTWRGKQRAGEAQPRQCVSAGERRSGFAPETPFRKRFSSIVNLSCGIAALLEPRRAVFVLWGA